MAFYSRIYFLEAKKVFWSTQNCPTRFDPLPNPPIISVTSCSSRLTFSRPPISSQLTLGTSTTFSRKAEGLLVPRAV
ncbi:hypothetical protein HanPSC8_Chr11g0490781 [Helianthus annuus]|nr:hypothetical protein HanPSC8_Chr11g0490781 [Helianthus annuus]